MVAVVSTMLPDRPVSAPRARKLLPLGAEPRSADSLRPSRPVSAGSSSARINTADSLRLSQLVSVGVSRPAGVSSSSLASRLPGLTSATRGLNGAGLGDGDAQGRSGPGLKDFDVKICETVEREILRIASGNDFKGCFVVVETCHSCDMHQMTTRHSEDRYQLAYDRVAEAVREVGMACQRLQMEPPHLRVGACEVYLVRSQGPQRISLIHSKLSTLRWPRKNNVRKAIAALVPSAKEELYPCVAFGGDDMKCCAVKLDHYVDSSAPKARDHVTELGWGDHGPKLDVSEDKKIVTDTAKDPKTGDGTGSRYRPILAERGFSKGVHRFTFELVSPGRILLGVCTDKVTSQSRDLHTLQHAWTLCLNSDCSGKPNLWNANKRTATTLPGVPVNGLLEVLLDCDKNIVKFIVGGEEASLTGLPAGVALYPCVAFGGDDMKGCAVKLDHYVVERREREEAEQKARDKEAARVQQRLALEALEKGDQRDFEEKAMNALLAWLDKTRRSPQGCKLMMHGPGASANCTACDSFHFWFCSRCGFAQYGDECVNGCDWGSFGWACISSECQGSSCGCKEGSNGFASTVFSS